MTAMLNYACGDLENVITFERAASPVRQPTSKTAVTTRLTMMKALSGMYPRDAERRAIATCKSICLQDPLYMCCVTKPLNHSEAFEGNCN